MTSHPLFMISHHAMTFTYTVFMSSQPRYLSSHHCSWAITYSLLIRARLPYVWYQTTICVKSYEFNVISQPLLLTSQDCIHDITSTIFLNTDPLNTTWHTLHLWHHSHCNYDKTPAMILTWSSVYMRSHPRNEWQHNDCIWHDTKCICVIQPTWLMTSQPMYVWNHTHCMHETIGTSHDITSTLADNIPMFLCHGTTLFMTSYVLYMMWPILCVWLPKLYIWLETC